MTDQNRPAIDLEARIRREVGRVITNVSNWPTPVDIHMLGRDLAEPIDKITAALLPAIREARAEALEDYFNTVEHVDAVIHGNAERDDRWNEYLISEAEYRNYEPDLPRSEMTSAAYYAKYRANQIRSNDE